MSTTISTRRQAALDLTKNKSAVWRDKSIEEWDRFAAKCVAEWYPEWCLKLIVGDHKTPYSKLLAEGMVPEWVHKLKIREVDDLLYGDEAEEFDEMVRTELAAKAFDTMIGAELFDQMVVDHWLAH